MCRSMILGTFPGLHFPDVQVVLLGRFNFQNIKTQCRKWRNSVTAYLFFPNMRVKARDTNMMNIITFIREDNVLSSYWLNAEAYSIAAALHAKRLTDMLIELQDSCTEQFM